MIRESSFSEHQKRVKIEGFKLHHLLSICAKEGIYFLNVVMESPMELQATVKEGDYPRLLRLARNQYKVTVLRDKGYKPMIRGLLSKKSMVAGVLIFIFFLYLQGLFISEIQITGYEINTETFVREKLEQAGIYEGCRKSFDIGEVKAKLYTELGNVSWVGMEVKGNLLKVEIVEMPHIEKKVSSIVPCNIVAKKYAMVEQTIARMGRPVVTEGAFVAPGETVISGIYPVESTAYGTPESQLTERYVHAEGEVIARVPYRFNFYIEKYDLIKEPTGKKVYGFDLKIADFHINTVDTFANWESWVYNEKKLIEIKSPFYMRLSWGKGSQVSLTKKDRSQKDIEKNANWVLRNLIKKNIPETGQILNKSLKFNPKVNIIEISTLVEVREDIGTEEEIAIGKSTE